MIQERPFSLNLRECPLCKFSVKLVQDFKFKVAYISCMRCLIQTESASFDEVDSLISDWNHRDTWDGKTIFDDLLNKLNK